MRRLDIFFCLSSVRGGEGEVPFTTQDKPQTHQTLNKHNQDPSNLRHIKPLTKNIWLSTTYTTDKNAFYII